VYKILEKVLGCNDVGIYTKKFSDHSLKNRQTQKADNKRRKIKKLSAYSDYGACYNGLGDEEMMDMPEATYQKIKQDFLNELTLCDVASIPILTMGQRNNDEWERLRNNRLTASNFGRIINMKLTTDTANTIKDILCRVGKSKFKKLPESLQWGIDNEEKAKQKFEEITGLNVSSCGLFVNTEKKFLGASPDGWLIWIQLLKSNVHLLLETPTSKRQ
jgi:hypothetical protein